MSKENKQNKTCGNSHVGECPACGYDPQWANMYSGPHITHENEWKREWIHAQPLRFYLYKVEGGKHDGKWCVIDRYYDLAHGKTYARKSDCIKAFIKMQSAPTNQYSH